MFLHLSVSHSVHGGSTWAGTPQAGTLPGTRYTPWDQVHPLGRYIPQDQVHPPKDQVHPQTRYTPHQDQVNPPGPGTPPQDQVHPLGPCTPPPPRTRYTPTQVTPDQCMLGDTGNKWAVRILLECLFLFSFSAETLKQQIKKMGNSTVMSIIAVVLILIAELLTIIAISTNYWGEKGDTYNGGTYKGRKQFIIIKWTLVKLT